MLEPNQARRDAARGVPSKDRSANPYATRNLLIDVGMRLLLRIGCCNLSCRKVAQEAKVNHALLHYHFGGLGGLVEAVFERCTRKLGERILPALREFDAELERTEPAEVRAFIRTYIPLLMKAFSGDESKAFITLLTSRRAHTGQAYDLLRTQILMPLHNSCARLVSRARNIPYEALETGILAQLVLTQLMAFFRGGSPVCAHMGWTAIPEGTQEIIYSVVAEGIGRTLGLASVESTEERPPVPGETAKPRAGKAGAKNIEELAAAPPRKRRAGKSLPSNA